MRLFENPENKANKEYIRGLQERRAAGELGMSEAQQQQQIALGTNAIGAQTAGALMAAGNNPAAQGAAIQGLQQAGAQVAAATDLASEQRAASNAAELAAQEQALFGRRKEKREFWRDTLASGASALGSSGGAGGAEGVATGLSSGAAGAAAAACWVAEELWGPAHRLTLDARLYCLTNRNWFTRLYTSHGRGWAAWLRRNPWARPLAARIWRELARRGAAQRLTFTERSA